MSASNWFKRIFLMETTSLVNKEVVVQTSPEYLEMISALEEKIPTNDDSKNGCCNDSGVGFDKVKFISMVLSNRDQTIDFLKRYSYAGYDQYKRDLKQLLDFGCCRSDVVDNPSEKWIYLDGLIEDIVSDQRFKSMNLGEDIVQILLNKDSEIQAQKIEKSHNLNAVSKMVENQIFNVEELRKVSKEVSDGHYNRLDQEKLRDDLIGKTDIQIQKKLLEEAIQGLGTETEAPKRQM